MRVGRRDANSASIVETKKQFTLFQGVDGEVARVVGGDIEAEKTADDARCRVGVETDAAKRAQKTMTWGVMDVEDGLLIGTCLSADEVEDGRLELHVCDGEETVALVAQKMTYGEFRNV